MLWDDSGNIVCAKWSLWLAVCSTMSRCLCVESQIMPRTFSNSAGQFLRQPKHSVGRAECEECAVAQTNVCLFVLRNDLERTCGLFFFSFVLM